MRLQGVRAAHNVFPQVRPVRLSPHALSRPVGASRAIARDLASRLPPSQVAIAPPANSSRTYRSSAAPRIPCQPPPRLPRAGQPARAAPRTLCRPPPRARRSGPLIPRHATHPDAHLVGHDVVVVADADVAALQLAHDDGAHLLPAVHDRQPHRCERVAAAAVVPAAHRLGHALPDVGSGERRDRQEHDLLLEVVSARLEERREAVADGVVTLSVPLAAVERDAWAVELVDDDQQARHAERLGQLRVLARLAAALKAGLKLALARRDEQDRNVRLARALDHVGDIVLVAGRIQHCVALRCRLEVRTADLRAAAPVEARGRRVARSMRTAGVALNATVQQLKSGCGGRNETVEGADRGERGGERDAVAGTRRSKRRAGVEEEGEGRPGKPTAGM
eukprot:343670-Chlamydomonas_euryale.AAC.2